MVCDPSPIVNYCTYFTPEGYAPLDSFARPRWTLGGGQTPGNIGRVIGYRTFQDSDACYIVDFGRYGVAVARPHCFDILAKEA
jgi:hypothetical protein